jgi:hypothetical protein
MMTSGSVEIDGVRFYRPEAVSVYCSSGGCNYDRLLAELPFPPVDQNRTSDAAQREATAVSSPGDRAGRRGPR